ncbi:MAG: DUF3795 domain-containing protein [Pseudomonadota bacterium]
MAGNQDLIAPCGLYCGVCAVYLATRDDNAKLKGVLAQAYQGKLPHSENLTPEQISCQGCLSGQTWGFCSTCAIRACAQERGLEGCQQCQDFPCQLIQGFPMAIGKKVIMRGIPRRAEVGVAQWLAEEEARYHCPACGQKLTRGAPRCHQCGVAVDLD